MLQKSAKNFIAQQKVKQS